MTRDDCIEEAHRIIAIADQASNDNESVEWELAVRKEIRCIPPHWRETISDTIDNLIRHRVRSI